MAFNLGKIVKGVALPFAAGAAKGYMAKRDELEKEFRENKRRQEQWMATNGRPAIAKDREEQDTVLSAAERIENAGLPSADVRQLLELHGPESIMELAKLVRTYEGQGKSLTQEMMEQAFAGIDDYEPDSSTIKEAVQNSFALVSSADTFDPVDTEEMGFLERLSYNLSGEREGNKLKRFLDEEYEGGLSINQTRELVTRGLPRGEEGLASFDSSVFQTGFSTEDKQYTNILKTDIEARTLQLLGENTDYVLYDASDNYIAASKVLANIIKVKDVNADVKVAYEQAVKESFKRTELWDTNKLAEQFFGGADYLSTLNMTLEEQLVEKGVTEEQSQLIVDNPFVKTEDETADVAKVTEFLEANPNTPFVIIDGNIMESEDFLSVPKKGGGEGGGGPVEITQTEFNPDTFELLVQPEPNPVIPPKPEPKFRQGAGGLTVAIGRPKNKEDIDNWEENNSKKYFEDGSKRYVSPRPEEESITMSGFGTPYQLWMLQWGESHDPETGFPLIDEGVE